MYIGLCLGRDSLSVRVTCFILVITIPNMNKIHWFISDIYITTNIEHLWNNRYKILHFGTERRYILHTSWHDAPIVVDCCTKYEKKSTHSFPRYHNNKHITCMKNIAIITQNLAWSQMLFYMHQEHIVLDYCTKYE